MHNGAYRVPSPDLQFWHLERFKPDCLCLYLCAVFVCDLSFLFMLPLLL